MDPSTKWMEGTSRGCEIKQQKVAGRGREKATDGECAAVTSVNLSV